MPQFGWNQLTGQFLLHGYNAAILRRDPRAAFERNANPRYCTTRVTVVEWTRLPAVPVIVNTKLPLGVFLFVETVRIEEPEPVTEAGLKLALVREGNPETLKLTVPVNPPVPVMVTV